MVNILCFLKCVNHYHDILIKTTFYLDHKSFRINVTEGNPTLKFLTRFAMKDMRELVCGDCLWIVTIARRKWHNTVTELPNKTPPTHVLTNTRLTIAGTNAGWASGDKKETWRTPSHYNFGQRKLSLETETGCWLGIEGRGQLWIKRMRWDIIRIF